MHDVFYESFYALVKIRQKVQVSVPKVSHPILHGSQTNFFFQFFLICQILFQFITKNGEINQLLPPFHNG
jgi:hypothetical protein